MASEDRKVMCVTGASGFIGSWIVYFLLRRGYAVRATVKDIQDEKETKHLESMEGADESRLRLFQIDLLDYDSIVAAVAGASGVIHVASPCTIDFSRDPERELLNPAREGTVNVLKAAKENGIRRVVITSSISAMTPRVSGLPEAVGDENCWSDEDYCRSKELWYPLSKTIAEKAAWKFAKEEGLDIVVVNPGIVLGPMIPPSVNASMLVTLFVIQGKIPDVPVDHFMGFVHVKDVALAHILLYENPSAAGRYLCVEAATHYNDFAAKMAELYPEYKMPRVSDDCLPKVSNMKEASKKLIDLGMKFASLDHIVQDCVQSLRTKGCLS
ncbi:cinnamoyl-CoA reductase 1-like [Andrographis paniculata]|uniref:cinnamoyl-CoA reductase 1-like n=1 Tax=Andrographis paniculata TaxID=175694 RepID=UPI0021E8E8AC|nr:cinnamoyl-CoA reductase 1-like [Andrographis paniculata]